MNRTDCSTVESGTNCTLRISFSRSRALNLVNYWMNVLYYVFKMKGGGLDTLAFRWTKGGTRTCG